MTLFGANNTCWLRRTGWSTLEHSGGPKQLQEVQVEVFDPVWSCGGVPPILAQERPKRAKWPNNGQNLNLRTLVLQNGWNSVERSCNKLQEPVGRGGTFNFVPGAPKKGQNGPKMAKL